MPTTYLVEVKPSVFAETSLIESDFDDISNMGLSEDTFDTNLHMEFRSREDAESWVEELSQSLNYDRDGRLRIQTAHAEDSSKADGYLLFKPR